MPSGQKTKIPDEVVAGIKWDWLNKQLHDHIPEFSDTLDCPVLLISWNVNGIQPPDSDSLQVLYSTADPVIVPELIAVGLQELVSPEQSGMRLWGGEEATESAAVLWGDRLLIAASTYFDTEFAQLGAVRLAGTCLHILAPRECTEHVTWMGSGTASCGLMGMLGNKGGVGARVRMWDSWMCIVNSHLAAHPEYTTRRNQDYREIRNRLLLPTLFDKRLDGRFAADKALELLRFSWRDGVTVDDNDVLIWMGDLNYRLDMTREEALQYIEDVDGLLCRDQLRGEIAAKRAFPDFTEPPISHRPTYKFDPGFDHYDTSEKARCPAYCDRILYRNGDRVAGQCKYSSPDLFLSDHKPVAAQFTVQAARIDEKRFEAEFGDLLHSLDLLENAQIPVTELVFPEGADYVDFGLVKFRRLCVRKIELRNTGQTAAHFSFLSSQMKPWIKASPTSGTLLAGNTVTISLNVLVGPKEAFPLNYHEDGITGTILIVNIVNGRDHFVAIEGTFKKTLFARQLELEYPTDSRGGNVALVPSPLRRLSEHILYHDGLRCANMLLQSADRSVVDTLIDCIDDNTDFPEQAQFESGMLAVGECLLRYLESLPVPVVPVSFSESFILVKQPEFASCKFMPDSAWIVFDYCLNLFRMMPAVNRTVDADSMCYVLGEALTRVSVLRSDRTADKQLIQFMSLFL